MHDKYKQIQGFHPNLQPQEINVIKANTGSHEPKMHVPLCYTPFLSNLNKINTGSYESQSINTTTHNTP